MKQSPDLTTAQERMKPGVITSCGFLGPDRRNLIEILVEDEALVQRLNTTHKQIAQRMKELRDKGLAGLGMFEKVEDRFEVKVDSMRGQLPSPFEDHIMIGKQNTVVRNLKLNKEVTYTDIHIHMIEFHGFYQGKGSVFRIEPEDLVEILEVRKNEEKPLPDYYPSGK